MAANVNVGGLSLAASEPESGSVQPGVSQSDGDRVQEITIRTAELLETVNQNLVDGNGNESDAKSKNKRLIWCHLSSCYRVTKSLQESSDTNELLEGKNPVSLSFGTGFEWINTEIPPNLAAESARAIIILEFFTHCCINCIHSIEDVRQVYGKFMSKFKEESDSNGGCQIKIISVHSPKFTREKDTDSIRAFVKRNRMTHTDVVNDPDCKLWNALNIYCWPTLLIFGPTRGPSQQEMPSKLNLIFTLVGEGHGHKENLETLLEHSLEFFNSKIDFSQVQPSSARDIVDSNVAPEQETSEPSQTTLRFPGKILLHNDQLVISDSGNNRLILCTSEGQVKEVIGGVQRGYVDGDFKTARFYNPQGVAVDFRDESVFYVADTGNHCVRQVDLKARMVSTLVEPHAATADNDQIVQLKSPWDLTFYGNDALLIAAAGNHQIFCYSFAPVQLFSVSHLPNCFDLVAGTGKEENRNNMYIRKASFCQPSGICVGQMQDENDKMIFVADSESSTIRMINSAGRVMPFVGGAKDPSNLFAYGDADGCGYDVRLQHPVGVCSAQGSKIVFIADTYNHKIKMIDRDTKHCATIIGTGTAGNVCGALSGQFVLRKRSQSPMGPKVHEVLAQLNEPNGISVNQEQSLLYIADTNNHCIKVAHLNKRTVTELKLSRGENSTVSTSIAGTSSPNTIQDFDQDYFIKLSPDSSAFSVLLEIYNLPTNLEGGEWRLGRYNEKTVSKSGMLNTTTAEIGTVFIEDLRVPDDSNMVVQVNIFFCGASSCYRKTLKFHLRVEVDDTIDKSTSEPFVLDYHPSVDFFKEA